MHGINVVATALLNRSDDNKALVSTIWSIVEDTQDNLRDLHKDLTSGEIPGTRRVAELTIP